MTSESTRKVIAQLNAAIEEANAELNDLGSSDTLHEADLDKRDRIISRQEKAIRFKDSYIRKLEEIDDFNTLVFILSMIVTFIAIGYAVWV